METEFGDCPLFGLTSEGSATIHKVFEEIVKIKAPLFN